MLPLLVRALHSRQEASVSLALKSLTIAVQLPLPGEESVLGFPALGADTCIPAALCQMQGLVGGTPGIMAARGPVCYGAAQ